MRPDDPPLRTVNRVAVIDYGLCNLDSVRRAVEEVGAEPYVVSTGTDLGEPDHIVLPGVGSFVDAMVQLTSRGLHDALHREVIDNGVPLLGICLGMQLLARQGAEGGDVAGLGWIDATVPRLVAPDPSTRIPHIGWNTVEPLPGATLFRGLEDHTDFYFVHSYHVVTADPDDVAAVTPYCGELTSAIEHDTIFGVQFHPEKSQRAGFQVLRNFLAV